MDGRRQKRHYICQHLLLLACGFHCHDHDLGLWLLLLVVSLCLLMSEPRRAQHGSCHLHVLEHVVEKLEGSGAVREEDQAFFFLPDAADPARTGQHAPLSPWLLSVSSELCAEERRMTHERHATMTITLSSPKVSPTSPHSAQRQPRQPAHSPLPALLTLLQENVKTDVLSPASGSPEIPCTHHMEYQPLTLSKS